MKLKAVGRLCLVTFLLATLVSISSKSTAADKLVGFHSARTIASPPLIATCASPPNIAAVTIGADEM